MLSPNRVPYVLRLHPFGLGAVGHDNVADIMTKPLGRAKFEKVGKILLNHEV